MAILEAGGDSGEVGQCPFQGVLAVQYSKHAAGQPVPLGLSSSQNQFGGVQTFLEDDPPSFQRLQPLPLNAEPWGHQPKNGEQTWAPPEGGEATEVAENSHPIKIGQVPAGEGKAVGPDKKQQQKCKP